MTDYTITPASHWRKPYSEGVPVELPTGTVVRLRPCYVSHLMRENFLPDALIEMVNPQAAKRKKKSDEEKTQDEIRKEWTETMLFAEKLCKLMFVHPRVVDNPSADDEISIDMLHESEIMFMIQLFNKPADELRSFRPQPTADVASVDTSTGNEQTGE